MIHSKYADIGHWLARCNHDTGLIELNRRDFPRLSAMMRDYVWVHEYVHLLYDVYNEDQCNAIADRIFVNRAKTANERIERVNFVNASAGQAISGIAVTAIISIVGTVVGLGVKGYQLYQKAKDNTGYYGLSSGDRYLLAKGLIKASFEAAPKYGMSPKELFWGLQSQCAGVETSYEAWLSNNDFANGLIAEFEDAYGRQFDVAIQPSLWSNKYIKTLAIILVLVAVVLVAMKLLKK